jgi:hypothetical protein
VEHYIVRKLSCLRSLPVTREIWVAIQEFFAMQKSVQLGGVQGRKKAIRYLLARRRDCTNSGAKLEGLCLESLWKKSHEGWGGPMEEQARGDGEDGVHRRD